MKDENYTITNLQKLKEALAQCTDIVATPDTEVPAAPAEPATEAVQSVSYKEGMYKVGTDIPAGEYYLYADSDNSITFVPFEFDVHAMIFSNVVGNNVRIWKAVTIMAVIAAVIREIVKAIFSDRKINTNPEHTGLAGINLIGYPVNQVHQNCNCIRYFEIPFIGNSYKGIIVKNVVANDVIFLSCRFYKHSLRMNQCY